MRSASIAARTCGRRRGSRPALCYLAVAALFALGMIAGGLLVCRSYGVTDALAAAHRRPARSAARAAAATRCAPAFLVWIYAWGIASDVVAKGGAPKPEADAVTRGMTASVVACTLWVVAWELVTVSWCSARERPACGRACDRRGRGADAA